MAAPEATGVISRVPVASDTLKRDLRVGAATGISRGGAIGPVPPIPSKKGVASASPSSKSWWLVGCRGKDIYIYVCVFVVEGLFYVPNTSHFADPRSEAS